MGFDEGGIVLDSPNGAYYPGQTVRGRLEFDLEKVKKFRGIYVNFKGWCSVHWTTSHTRQVQDRRETYTVSHDSSEEYFNRRIYLVGAKDGEHHLQPGHHVFSFDCQLPASCPSSFEGSHGHIRYEVKAVVDRAFKFDQEKTAAFRIVAPIDMNLNPFCSEPVQIEISNTFCCWCIGSGSADTLVKLPVSGYCPGQVIPIEVSCTNRSNVEIDKIKFVVKREITFRAEQNPDSRKDEEDIVEYKTGSVPGNNNRNWTIEMSVPPIDVYNLDSCRFIDVDYYFKVLVETGGCHEDGEESRKIIIGTIPLRGFQDNIENPMKDQMPQQPYVAQEIQGVNAGYPIVNQPLPSNTPYPAPNYPNGSQYPNPYQNPSPYPTGNIGPNPYGGGAANMPNVGANIPYQGGNPSNQYPGSNLNPPNIGYNQYGGSASNLPNIGANQPYHGGNPNTGSPYPASTLNPPNIPNQYGSANNLPNIGQTPYPGPYPYPNDGRGPSPLPYPTGQGQDGSFMKAGMVGFAVQTNVKSSDEASIPLLPQGAGVPYPRSPSPYATASAPEPATPDREDKNVREGGNNKTPGNEQNSPYPYNPNYHEEGPKNKD